jgi:ATP-dependent DNA helicase RecG
LRSGLKLVSVLKDEQILSEAQVVARKLVDLDPEFKKHEAFKSAVENLIQTQQAEYVKKS